MLVIVAHLTLHSYPTRRSSDLFPQPAGCPSLVGTVSGNATIVNEQTNPSQLPVVVGFVSIRSEEHTSELQSLRHLVCRLLLEKKNLKLSSIYTIIAHLQSILSI